MSSSLTQGIASAMFEDVFPARLAHAGTYGIENGDGTLITTLKAPYRIDVTRLLLEKLLDC